MIATINKPPIMERVIIIARKVVSDFAGGAEGEDEVEEVGREGMQLQ